MTHANSKDRRADVGAASPPPAREADDAAVLELFDILFDGEEAPPACADARDPDVELAAVPPLRGDLLEYARQVATSSDWPSLCPDPRCKPARECVGGARRLLPHGPRGYPGCYALALRQLLAPASLSAEDSRAADPLVPYVPEGAKGGEHAPELPVDALLEVLVTHVRLPGGAAAWLAARRDKAVGLRGHSPVGPAGPKART